MLDVRTQQLLPDDSPEMVAVLRLWNALSHEDKQAWHRFTCQNSRAVADIAFAKRFSDDVQEALLKPCLSG
jgi:hypothetical protein